MAQVPENLYRGELVSYPGPWAFELGRQAIILVSDQELEALADPDRVLDISTGFDKQEASLRQVCERARAAGQRTLIIAFDHFFSQYRPGQDKPRTLTPDLDEYVRRIAAISAFAQGYGLGLELSLLSPLEIGPAYTRATGESGLWLQYRKGLRDPVTGAFSVPLWEQRKWANNKGVIALEASAVRVFAFREQALAGTPHRVVKPEWIREISDVAQIERWDDGGRPLRRVRVFGQGHTDLGDLDRVLVVLQYRTPEMDYFSPQALPFLKGLLDKYAAAGVKLNALYSDEMHIQQDWGYFNHHDHGEFAQRYVSAGLARRFAQLYGAEYADFAKYLVYFCHGQEDDASDLSAKQDVGHVFGASPRDIRATALFRSRYYRLLQDGVVDLFVQAKRHAEQGMGHRLETRAHATWAESPTIDKWETGRENHFANAYEYTSNFVWSNTVHQASSACYDYFRWGDYLTGNGNDHAECGWLDRNYVGLSLACSTGILNEVPYSYAAHWGMPDELAYRRGLLAAVSGTAGGYLGMVQDNQHRDVDVLMLYPLDLVAVDERFGSWMTQYGYANQITSAKLLERGKVSGNALAVADRRFTTLVATFEPFPPRRLLDLMREFAMSGGRVIWSGPPPLLTAEGEDALPAWQELFGVTYEPGLDEGQLSPGRQVVFEGPLAAAAPQTILTDLLPDRTYPVAPREGAAAVARVKDRVVGATRRLAGGGTATFLGYRPRDDQSKSLGYDVRNLFEVLVALGAYPPSGRFEGVNDNTEVLSRTGPHLVCRFPNGTIALANHLRDVEEDWPGGFARNAEQDKQYLQRCPAPSLDVRLKDLHVAGHTVTYSGVAPLAFRLDDQGRLIAFACSWADRVTIDGKEHVFADKPLSLISWAPVPDSRRVPGGALLQARIQGEGVVRLPAAGLPDKVALFAEGPTPGSRGEAIPCRLENGALVFATTSATTHRWLYVVAAE
ncbi:MAG: hypothetical protein HZB16_09825 [Armatimonadetes bacterium]|nr:hypothetical protein [Armatimonadota bacterium]